MDKRILYRPSERMENNPALDDMVANILHEDMFKLFLRTLSHEERFLIMSRRFGMEIPDLSFIEKKSERTIMNKMRNIKGKYKAFFSLQ